jgi:DNA-binding NarL/FixJ family response regulator
MIVAEPSDLVEALRRSLLEISIEVRGVVATSAEAIDMDERDHWDLILVARDLSKETGLEAGRNILEAASGSTLVLFGAPNDQDEFLLAIKTGFRGYFSDELPPVDLATEIERLARGEDRSPVGTDLIRPPLPGYTEDATKDLSALERSVFQLVADGMTTRVIAERLGLTGPEVESCVARIRAKLDAAAPKVGGRQDDEGTDHLHAKPLGDSHLTTHLQLLHPHETPPRLDVDLESMRTLHDELHRRDHPTPA